MSFFAQLLPGINWGLVAVVLTPKALQKYHQDLYYKILLLLRVNRNTKKSGRPYLEYIRGLVSQTLRYILSLRRCTFFSKNGTERTPPAR